MNKGQLIDDIRKLNATAQPAFLARFDAAALRHYLDHLREAYHKRLRFEQNAPAAPQPRLAS